MYFYLADRDFKRIVCLEMISTARPATDLHNIGPERNKLDFWLKTYFICRILIVNSNWVSP